MIVGSAKWFFDIKEIPPIVRGYGITDEKRLESPLVSMAVNFIKKANNFNGIPFQIHNIPQENSQLIVSFSLIFKTTQDALAYIEELKKTT